MGLITTDPNFPPKAADGPQSSWGFLDDELQAEGGELLPWLSGLIDWSLPPPSTAENYPLNPLISRLNLNYEDDEAVAAYFNKFIAPIVGTRPAIELAFKLLGTQATLIEWFQSETPLPPFKFVVQFDTYPANVDFTALIELIYALKNERSFPTILRLAECVDNLVWDYGSFDTETMDADEGYLNELGVMICLYQRYVFHATLDAAVPHLAPTGLYSEHLDLYTYMRYDEYLLSDPWDVSWNAASIGYSSQVTYTEQYYMQDEVCDVQAPGYCKISHLTTDAYSTATFDCQLVFSDYGTLSGGEGFIGAYPNTTSRNVFDDTNYDDLDWSETVVYQFIWEKLLCDHLDFSGPDYAVSSTIASVGMQFEVVDAWAGAPVFDGGEVLFVGTSAITTSHASPMAIPANDAFYVPFIQMSPGTYPFTRTIDISLYDGQPDDCILCRTTDNFSAPDDFVTTASPDDPTEYWSWEPPPPPTPATLAFDLTQPGLFYSA